MRGHFGAAYADSIAVDHRLADLGGRCAADALAAGEDPKVVWQAVCQAFDVPPGDR